MLQCDNEGKYCSIIALTHFSIIIHSFTYSKFTHLTKESPAYNRMGASNFFSKFGIGIE